MDVEEDRRVRMEMDRICTDTNSDISDNYIYIFFQFPSLRIETDRIRTDTDSNISDIFEYPFFYFLTVFVPTRIGRSMRAWSWTRFCLCAIDEDSRRKQYTKVKRMQRQAALCLGDWRVKRESALVVYLSVARL